MPTRGTLRLGAALLVTLVVAGCSGSTTRTDADSTPSAATSSTPTPSAPQTIVVTPRPLPQGVHLSFIQQRIDEGTRRSQVRVVNGTDHTIRVKTVAIDWAGYPAAPYRVDYPVPPQATVDLRYLLPRAVCTDAASAAPINAVAVTRGGPIKRKVQSDGVRFLTRLHSAECDRRRLGDAVDIAYGDRWVETGTGTTSRLHGYLTLDRGTGNEDITITQVEGSVLYDLELEGAHVLEAGRPSGRVPIVARSGGRCDPHSRGQSTQTFLFRVFVRVGDGPEISRLLPPSKPQQVRLLRFLDHACAGSS